MRFAIRFALVALLAVATTATAANNITPPDQFFGFQLGADGELAHWDKIVEYFELLDRESDRIQVTNLGPSTEGHPYLLVIISSPENMANLDRLREVNKQIQDPHKSEAEVRELIKEGKAVVSQSFGLHSTEVAGAQTAPELAYDFVSRDDEETQRILDNTILLLFPNFNPDGQIMVRDWYYKNKGTEFEGVGLPWLYHKYVGHDNNRDADYLNMVEAVYTAKVLYRDWKPQAYVDHHQMGSYGARFYVPPYSEPIRPYADPLVWRELSWYGAHIAYKLEENGMAGVLNAGQYPGWGHFGWHWITPFHNMSGMLTESASASLATPLYLHPDQLRGGARGLPKYEAQSNMPNPWPGGWWRLGDIIDYEEAAAYSILSSVAKRKEMFLKNFYKMGLSAVEKGKDEPPRAFLMPTAQRQPNTALKMLEILQRGGVEIHQANANFTADGVEYPQGTYVISMAQPFRAHAKDLLEAQRYPQRRASPNAPTERPYDITGWTLPLQMGVRVVKVINEFEADLKRVEKIPKIQGKLHTIPETVAYFFKNQTNAETIALNRLLKEEEYTLHQSTTEHAIGNQEFPRGSILVTTTKIPSQVGDDFQELAESLGIEIYALNHIPFKDPTTRLSQPRLGLYKPWVANIDEGWTRWVLEQHEFVYRNLTDAEIRAGSLAERYDVIILPDMRASAMIDGHAEGTLPPEYVGGIGSEGAANLRTFVVNGGTLICLNRATELPDKYFGLEITNVLDSSNQSNRKESEVERFFCPGSLLRIFVKKTHPIGYGLSREMAAFFKSGPAFEVRGGKEVASYPDFNPLMSGWIQGDKQIRRKGALWDVNLGEGHVILFGFKPQHRAQAHGTFKLLFNAIYYGVTGK